MTHKRIILGLVILALGVGIAGYMYISSSHAYVAPGYEPPPQQSGTIDVNWHFEVTPNGPRSFPLDFSAIPAGLAVVRVQMHLNIPVQGMYTCGYIFSNTIQLDGFFYHGVRSWWTEWYNAPYLPTEIYLSSEVGTFIDVDQYKYVANVPQDPPQGQ